MVCDLNQAVRWQGGGHPGRSDTAPGIMQDNVGGLGKIKITFVCGGTKRVSGTRCCLGHNRLGLLEWLQLVSCLFKTFLSIVGHSDLFVT